MTRRRDIKKSEFVQTDVVGAADTFDFVSNGQNFKISRTDLLAALGVTGQLQTRGEITAIPVLTVIGDVNYIRNILSGAGVLVVNSPQDGIQISHNFTVDKAGIPIMINEGSDSPTLRSISGTGGIAVSASGNEVSISAGTPVSAKTVQVYTIDDFPTPSGGVITLLDDTQYLVQNDISSANRYVFGENTILSGADGALVTLEYTGSGAMLTAVDKNIKIKDLVFSCPSGSLYDISSTTGAHSFRHYIGNVACNEMGTIHNMGVVFVDNVRYVCTTNGVLFSGNISICILSLVGVTIPSGTGTGIDLGTAVFVIFQLFQAFGQVNTTGYAIDGLPDSGNIDVTGLGSIQNSKQFGTALSLNGIGPYDDRWEMQFNADVPNSNDLCLVTHGGATITIAAAATPVIVGATWIAEDTHRFDTTIGGRFTYTGKGTHISIDASITADIATGIDDVSFFIYINGVQIVNSRVTREFDSGNPGNLSMIWETPLETNDYIELWVQNDDTSVNIDIVTATLRLRS